MTPTPPGLLSRGRKTVSVGRSWSSDPRAPGAPFGHSGMTPGSCANAALTSVINSSLLMSSPLIFQPEIKLPQPLEWLNAGHRAGHADRTSYPVGAAYADASRWNVRSGPGRRHLALDSETGSLARGHARLH